jgi:hypothetical protein
MAKPSNGKSLAKCVSKTGLTYRRMLSQGSLERIKAQSANQTTGFDLADLDQAKFDTATAESASISFSSKK